MQSQQIISKAQATIKQRFPETGHANVLLILAKPSKTIYTPSLAASCKVSKPLATRKQKLSKGLAVLCKVSTQLANFYT